MLFDVLLLSYRLMVFRMCVRQESTDFQCLGLSEIAVPDWAISVGRGSRYAALSFAAITDGISCLRVCDSSRTRGRTWGCTGAARADLSVPASLFPFDRLLRVALAKTILGCFIPKLRFDGEGRQARGRGIIFQATYQPTLFLIRERERERESTWISVDNELHQNVARYLKIL